jgi:hypothetical protein
MIARNVTQDAMETALAVINRDRFEGNIVFKRFDKQGKGFLFTLTVKVTHYGTGKKRIPAPGVRRSWGGDRLIPAACWHVHGYFFEELFKIAPGARVYSSFYKRDSGDGWIDARKGNWIDGNIGSMMQPCRMSEACFCTHGPEVREVKQSEMTAECWLVQFGGLKACETCEARDTEDCGGKEIRRTLLNEKGFPIPIGK